MIGGEKFQTSGLKIQFHPKVKDDINRLFPEKNKRDEFLRKLYPKLEILSANGFSAIFISHEFEILKQTKGLYAFAVNAKDYNIRIVYHIDGGNNIILHGFFEREGKNMTSYKKHIEIAQNRR